MINTKYRVRDVAKDLDVKTNYVTELIEKSFGGAKKSSMTALESDELDLLFDTVTKENAVDSFDEYFALKSKKEAPEMKEEAQQPEQKSEEKSAEKKEAAKPAQKSAPAKEAKPAAKTEKPAAKAQTQAAKPAEDKQPKAEIKAALHAVPQAGYAFLAPRDRGSAPRPYSGGAREEAADSRKNPR